jgi:predicted ATPase/DNA-binding XRE family transcriptional regulator
VAVRQESFGERLRRFREAAGYSQEHLAERAGMSANAVGALERGERKRPYPDTVRRLAEALALDDGARLELAALRHGHEATEPPSDEEPVSSFAALPGEPTPFIGRDHEVAELRRLITEEGNRLVTLVGPGGVGKTRLALHAARLATDEYDAVVWVELTPLTEPQLVLATIARTIGLEESIRGDHAGALRDWIRDRHVLLVLDNLEHLLDAGPELAHLVPLCPRLHLLTTSRAPLRVRGEREFPVHPLALPPAGTSDDPEDPAEFDAVRFFVWHAQQREPDFELTDESALLVAEICRRLEGLPLALELAAARINVLSPVEMLERVDHLMPLLVGGARDLPERQRTMRAAIAWSEDLLHPEERTLFRQLSVFAGGWALDAAEAIAAEAAADIPTVLDRLHALAGQSLVTVVHGSDGTRYGMLEPVRQYAVEALADAGEEDVTRRRHARYFVSLAERAAAEIEGRSGQTAWMKRLEREQDNLRAALAWSEQADDGIETGLRLATALWRFWEMRWRVAEGDRWLAGALARSNGLPLSLRANALNAAGNLARDLGDYRRATAHHEECLAIRRELGAPRGVAISLNNLGVIARDQGHAERTLALCGESLGLFREAGDRHGAAIALISLGTAARQQGDLVRARSSYEESLELFRAEGDRWHTAWVLTYLALLMVQSGDLPAARSLADEALAMHRAAGEPWGMATALAALGRADQADSALDLAAARFAEALRLAAAARVERAIPSCLDDLAGVLLAAGEPAGAARLAGAAEAWRADGGLTRVPEDQDRAASLHALRTGPHAASWRAGYELPRERVLVEAAAVPDTIGSR